MAQAPKQTSIVKRMEHFTLSRQAVLLGTMILASILCVVLFGYRVSRSHTTVYATLNWNLFLAWVPAAIALVAYNVVRRRSCLAVGFAISSVLVWILFFPNAPYLMTDIIHLTARPEMAFWFDMLLYLAYSWTGCYLGLVSLLMMQTVIRRLLGTIMSWIFSLIAILLSGFGIFLGRFERWNSWDIFLHPLSILREIGTWIIRPQKHTDVYIFAIVFSIFFAVIYFIVAAILNLRKEETA